MSKCSSKVDEHDEMERLVIDEEVSEKQSKERNGIQNTLSDNNNDLLSNENDFKTNEKLLNGRNSLE